MSAADSIPPEDPHLRSQVRALAFQVEGLSRLLLGLEGAIRELIGEVRADRASRAAEAARASQPHPVASATVATLQALGSDAAARVWLARAVFLLVSAVAIGVLSYASVAAASPLSGLFFLADHYLSPGKAP